jgi:protein-disulfide isomerase
MFLGRLRRIDPYFAAGVLAMLIVSGAVAWSRRGPERPTLRVFPAAVVKAYETSGVALVLGPANAPIRITELSDFGCPACAKAHADLWPRLDSLVKSGRVRYTGYQVTWKPRAINATAAVACVGDAGQEASLRYRSQVYAHQFEWMTAFEPNSVLAHLAAGIGADSATVVRCIERTGPQLKPRYDSLTTTASGAGVTFTPMFAIGDRVVTKDSIKKVIEAR